MCHVRAFSSNVILNKNYKNMARGWICICEKYLKYGFAKYV